MRISRAAGIITTAAFGIMVASVACLDPTQITVDMSTDVKCEDTKGTSIAGGSPGGIELSSPTTTTRDCDNGHIGTIVSTPSDSKDVDAAFVIVMGVDRPVSECTAENHFQGCVVQRRLIHYVKHTPLNLPVTMWLVCKDVECGPETTCARNGKCVSARIADPETCSPGPCFVDGDGPFVPPGSDGGPDAPVADGEGGTDGGGDGSIKDGPVDSPIIDATYDGPEIGPPPDAGPDGGSLTKYCPQLPNPAVTTSCPTADTCCFSHNAQLGQCAAPAAFCAPNGSDIEMHCTRASDCNGGNRCCGTVVAAIDGGAVPAKGQPSQLVLPVGSRLTRSDCAASCTGNNVWVCTTAADCPPAMPSCVQTSGLFNPSNVFGVCE